MRRPTTLALIAAAPLALAPLLAPGLASPADAANAGEAEAKATIHKVTKDGKQGEVGSITFRDTEHGLMAEPSLHNITAGAHGLHIHENADCGPGKVEGEVTAAGAAGGHLNPDGKGSHKGPYKQGHLGDMPNLIASQDGNANVPVVAPKLKLSDVTGHAVMIHAKMDHYAKKDEYDTGSGGSRAYCGVIKES